MSNDHNYRENILPPHCGNCMWLTWEEEICECTHPAFVEDEYIDDLIECDEPESAAPELVKMIACYAQDRQSNNSDWHAYNGICDLWHSRPTGPTRKDEIQRMEAQAFDLLKKRVAERINAALRGEGENE